MTLFLAWQGAAVVLAAVPCDAERTATAKWLIDAASQVDRNGAVLSREPDLVKRAGEPAPLRSTVNLRATGVAVGGIEVTDLKAELLRQKNERELVYSEKEPLLVLVGRSVPWKRVVATVKAIREAGVDVVTFGFEDQLTAAEPGPSPIDAEVARVNKLADPQQMGKGWRLLWTRIAGGCDALEGALMQGLGEYDVKPTLERLAAALSSCECKVDLASLRRLVWLTLVPQPRLSGVRVALGAGTAAVTLAGETPWSDAAEKVVAAARGQKPVGFEVAR